MNEEEIKKRLLEFTEYLDNMKPSLKKGKLSKFWLGYVECYNRMIKLEYINKGEKKWKN